jgi:hypothetical protein
MKKKGRGGTGRNQGRKFGVRIAPYQGASRLVETPRRSRGASMSVETPRVTPERETQESESEIVIGDTRVSNFPVRRSSTPQLLGRRCRLEE